MINIIIGILPGLLFAFIFYFLDKKRKNINIAFLIGTFIMGCISSYIAYRLEWHFGSYFKEMKESNLFEVFIYAIFGVAIFEEGLKLFFSSIFSRINKVRELTNIITYCVVTSCGFLAFENAVFYSTNSFSRLFTASPSHICYGIIMGLLLYKVSDINWKSFIYLFLAFIIPSLLHAIYNTFLYQNISKLFIFSYIYLIVLVIICLFIIIKYYFLKKDE